VLVAGGSKEAIAGIKVIVGIGVSVAGGITVGAGSSAALTVVTGSSAALSVGATIAGFWAGWQATSKNKSPNTEERAAKDGTGGAAAGAPLEAGFAGAP